MGGCCNFPALTSHGMTASWLAATTQMRGRYFLRDALPAATLLIYPGLEKAHIMLDCTLQCLVKTYASNYWL